MSSEPDFMVGDVIQISNSPFPEMRDKWFRVESIEGGEVRLSKPYHDTALTKPFDGTGGLAHLSAIGYAKPR